MATIANLTKKDDGFSGTLILPSLNGMKITFEPVKNPTDNGPDYRVTIGGFEAGAAWSRKAAAGGRISDPSRSRGLSLKPRPCRRSISSPWASAAVPGWPVISPGTASPERWRASIFG